MLIFVSTFLNTVCPPKPLQSLLLRLQLILKFGRFILFLINLVLVLLLLNTYFKAAFAYIVLKVSVQEFLSEENVAHTQ